MNEVRVATERRNEIPSSTNETASTTGRSITVQAAGHRERSRHISRPAYIDWLPRLRMFPSGSLNQTAFMFPIEWTSPSRVVPGRSS
jgi:hypothetical protein